MNKKLQWALVLVVVLGIVAVYRVEQHMDSVSQVNPSIQQATENPTVPAEVTTITPEAAVEVTERYSGQVDRSNVVFEHVDYTEYRLITNGVVRSGELNTERGYQADPDATVYVLNWQQPVGEQLRYVRLTAEPDLLYLLNTDDQIVQGSVLRLE